LDDEGASLHREASEVESMLLDAFGGWNKVKSQGAWKDPNFERPTCMVSEI
jgi:hypothetical protein